MSEATLPQGTIHYRESGEGEPIVFLHGLLVDGRLWRKVTPLLEDRFRCIVPDLPLGSHRLVARSVGYLHSVSEISRTDVKTNQRQRCHRGDKMSRVDNCRATKCRPRRTICDLNNNGR